jgi:p38 MAP kinase
MGCISTIHYRAPEVFLTGHSYNEQADIWSAGCIFAQMLSGKPLFQGQNYIHQLHSIIQLLGSPSNDVFPNRTIPNVRMKELL